MPKLTFLLVIIVSGFWIFLLGYLIGHKTSHDTGVTPLVGVTLREGYGLSTTKRPGWVRATYHGRTWWISPADIQK